MSVRIVGSKKVIHSQPSHRMQQDKSSVCKENLQVSPYKEAIVTYGREVFNQEEEKFQVWLATPNACLGGTTPMSLLDTPAGRARVKNCLDNIQYGNFA